MLVDLLGLMNNLKAWLGWLAFSDHPPHRLRRGHILSVGGASNLIVFSSFRCRTDPFRETIFQPRVLAWAWLGTITSGMRSMWPGRKWLHFNDTGERLILVFSAYWVRSACLACDSNLPGWPKIGATVTQSIFSM